METLTREIYKGQYYWLKGKIDQVNKKADKLGTPPVTLETGAERIIKLPPDDFTPYERVKVYIEITLHYEIPVIEEWKLTARFEVEETPDRHDLDKINRDVFTYTAPGETLPADYLNKDVIECQHCGHRRRRNKSFLMRHLVTGQYKEVGSTCIKDFFGHDPAPFLFMASFDPTSLLTNAPEDFDPDAYGGRSGADIFDIYSFLTVAAACIDSFGWRSRTAAYDNPYDHTPATAEVALFQLTTPDLKKEERPDVTDDHRDLAQAATGHFKDLDPDGDEYLTNCQKIARREYVSPKTAGYAASMIISYRMHVKRQLIAEAKAKRPPSNWLGEIKQRLTVKATCIFCTTIDGYYGTSDLYIFIDDQGNKVKTFYSGTAWSIEQGETADLTGTIKDLETYEGEKVTVLTRCKVN
ncbi:MAG: hypothetical protein GY757_53670 [bacterium]|nr:hypothetical protein [bacterium]